MLFLLFILLTVFEVVVFFFTKRALFLNVSTWGGKRRQKKESFLCTVWIAACISVLPRSVCAVTPAQNTPHCTWLMYMGRWACLSASECPHSWTIVSYCVGGRIGCEWMTNPSLCLCTRSLKTPRERSTRQISPPWPRLPLRMAPRSTSFPSLRSPCLSPSSLADPVRHYTAP